MRLQVLLSAMNLKDESYVDSLNITSDAVVVNQWSEQSPYADTLRDECGNVTGILSIERIKRNNINGDMHEVVFIESSQKGLSRSRNMAIEASNADICILCDNDVEYVPYYDRIILKAFEKYSDADLIVFYIKRKEKPEPNYKKEKRMGYLSVLKIFSPEIAFKRDSIKGISFNPMFGAGARYQMGEENIFLYDCLKKGKKIYYVPVKIAELREEESTWFKGYDREFFVSRGANYAMMTKTFYPVLILQYAVRKRKLYKDETSFVNAVKYMFEGSRLKGVKVYTQ
ncbi:MAG: glycosyltransferase family 2 protein [Lachnospiraceae bacterium]|nr:glycosyltransferase family 2 protein [Lachnospiraceae bacterium]